MQTTTPTRRRVVRLSRTGDSIALVITEQKGARVQCDAYYLSPIQGGYRFSKHDCTVYDVTPATCTCKGNQRWGHCKHRESLQALKERGKL
jgi:hypothetical protein